MKLIDYTITETEIKLLDDAELARLFVLAEKDMEESIDAFRVWVWCIEEINNRIDMEECEEYEKIFCS